MGSDNAPAAERLTVHRGAHAGRNCDAGHGPRRPADYYGKRRCGAVSRRVSQLLFKRVKIDTFNLEEGMFVAQLDRPWLETPFLLQGFEIREESEIGLLRKFCKHVYVDVERSRVPKDRILEAHNSMGKSHDPFVDGNSRGPVKSAPLSYRLLSALGRVEPSGWLARRVSGRVEYRNQVDTRSEAPKAAHAYGIAVDHMNQVFESVRKGERIQVAKVREAAGPMIDSVLRNQDAMAWLVTLRKRDEYAYNHSIASSVWAVILGRHLGFDRSGLQTLAMGGMLLDLGKAKIPESIVDKEGPLDETEFAIMQQHVDWGVALARKAPGINDAIIDMIASHHERHDGSGYPNGLSGGDIPVFGRIAGLVDCYDAMISKRPHAQARSSYDAVRELNLLSGTGFQRELVEQFVQSVGMFPTGSLVEMNSGEVGIVIEQNDVRRLRPKVMLLLNADKQPLTSQKVIDLKKLSSDEQKRSSRWIVAGHEAGAFGIDPKDYFG
jgi:HD-GYP domain-containing protein (c-di-GMP phosphodiesterase class II)